MERDPGAGPGMPAVTHGTVPMPPTLHGPHAVPILPPWEYCVHMHFVTAEVPFAKHCAMVTSPDVSSQAETLEMMAWWPHCIVQLFTFFIAYTESTGGHGFGVVPPSNSHGRHRFSPSSSRNMHPLSERQLGLST